MSFEQIEEDEPVANFSGICPTCGNVMTFIHDLRCPICDNKRIQFCPACGKHRRLKL